MMNYDFFFFFGKFTFKSISVSNKNTDWNAPAFVIQMILMSTSGA